MRIPSKVSWGRGEKVDQAVQSAPLGVTCVFKHYHPVSLHYSLEGRRERSHLGLSQKGGVPSSLRDCCPLLVVDTVALSDRDGCLLGYVLSLPPFKRDRRPGVSTVETNLMALPHVFIVAPWGSRKSTCLC